MFQSINKKLLTYEKTIMAFYALLSIITEVIGENAITTERVEKKLKHLF